MTIPKRLEILREHAPQVKWHFDVDRLRFVGTMGRAGVRCLIEKDATRAQIVRLALEVQSELRETKRAKASQ